MPETNPPFLLLSADMFFLFCGWTVKVGFSFFFLSPGMCGCLLRLCVYKHVYVCKCRAVSRVLRHAQTDGLPEGFFPSSLSLLPGLNSHINLMHESHCFSSHYKTSFLSFFPSSWVFQQYRPSMLSCILVAW